MDCLRLDHRSAVSRTPNPCSDKMADPKTKIAETSPSARPQGTGLGDNRPVMASSWLPLILLIGLFLSVAVIVLRAQAEAGYGSHLTAVRPNEAFPLLIARQREELLQRERLVEKELIQRKRLAEDLARQLESLADPTSNNGEPELIQVLRDPRVCAERFNRLQLEAQREIHIFVKAPILNPSYSNPTQRRAMRRGVQVRALYERAILDAPEIKPYLSRWIAEGEEARVYDGELPHKLAIFDRQNILIPLVPPGGRLGKILFIRHPQLAASLGMLFEFLWEGAKQIAFPVERASQSGVKPTRRKGR